MDDLFDRFLQERTYLHNVSPETLRYYRWVRRAFAPILTQPGKEGMLKCVERLLADGVSAVSVNTYLRGLKAYVRWLHQEGQLRGIFKVQFLRTEQKVLQTFSPAHCQALIRYKPESRNEARAHMVACVILDCGLRISEALSLTPERMDFDNLCLRLNGKGSKERLVPISLQLRRLFYRWQQKHAGCLVFGTRNGTKMTVRNFERDFKRLCQKLGIAGVRCSRHTLRHTMAVGYLRNGGNIYYLSKILGHTSVKTTERYLQSLGLDNLKAVHNGLSLLWGTR